jgi:hypothetical protein
MILRRWFRRVRSEALVQDAAHELRQFAEQKYLEREIVTNTSELAKAFGAVMDAMGEVDKAVVLVGSLLIARHAGPDGRSNVFCQTLSAEQLRHVQANPGILASPERVLEMLAVSMAGPQPAGALPPSPP